MCRLFFIVFLSPSSHANISPCIWSGKNLTSNVLIINAIIITLDRRSANGANRVQQATWLMRATQHQYSRVQMKLWPSAPTVGQWPSAASRGPQFASLYIYFAQLSDCSVHVISQMSRSSSAQWSTQLRRMLVGWKFVFSLSGTWREV